MTVLTSRFRRQVKGFALLIVILNALWYFTDYNQTAMWLSGVGSGLLLYELLISIHNYRKRKLAKEIDDLWTTPL